LIALLYTRIIHTSTPLDIGVYTLYTCINLKLQPFKSSKKYRLLFTIQYRNSQTFMKTVPPFTNKFVGYPFLVTKLKNIYENCKDLHTFLFHSGLLARLVPPSPKMYAYHSLRIPAILYLYTYFNSYLLFTKLHNFIVIDILFKDQPTRSVPIFFNFSSIVRFVLPMKSVYFRIIRI